MLVEVDSEAAVPHFVARLRVDLYTLDGTWYESREVRAPDPADWPLSFSLFSHERAGKTVRLRVRGFPEGGLRDFRGERFAPPPLFVEPPSAHSLEELCAAPPLLDEGATLELRRAAGAITEIVAQGDCAPPTRAGSAAARVAITEAGSYRFEVTAAEPAGVSGHLGGDTTLALRRSCADPSSQIVCNDDIDRASDKRLSRFVVTLDPGEYFLITGGNYAAPADLTLRWARADRWDAPSPSPSPIDEAVPDGFDRVEGGATPGSEPHPSVTIDLVRDLRIELGKRKTARLLLRGQCLGTQADLRGGTSCVETAGARAPIANATLVDGIQRGASSVAGSWTDARPRDCTLVPRTRGTGSDGTPLFDEEVCVPGGAFTLGSSEIVGLADFDAVPQQPALIEPFLIDAFEITVGRYRQALRDGFRPPDDTPYANDAPLFLDASVYDDRRLCHFSTAPMGRERLPLNCTSWYNARALCRFWGGDLPTHAEWEYAAVAAGRRGGESRYPWGAERPDCCRAAHSRGIVGEDCVSGGGASQCAFGRGAVAVDADPWLKNDVSAIGVMGLAGNVSEWALDSALPYRSSCWFQRALRGVGCDEREAIQRSARGGNWAVEGALLRSATLAGFSPALGIPVIGARCVRR